MPRRLLLILALAATIATTRVSAHDPLGFDGTVVKMDTGKRLLTIRVIENGQPVTYDITLDSKTTSKTTITQAGKNVSRAALKPGVRVHVNALGCIDEVEIDAVYVEILPPAGRAPAGQAMDMSMPGMDMSMPGMTASPTAELGTEIPKGDRIPTVALRDGGFKNGTWSFTVETSLSLVNAMTYAPYQPMRGHLHVYLDGHEILMIASKTFTVKDLTPGPHTVRVVLSGTDHRTLLHDGKPIEASHAFVVK